MNIASIVLGFAFGTFGLVFFRNGIKRGQFTPVLCGIGLMLFPYFVENPYWMAGIGLPLMAAPLFVRD